MEGIRFIDIYATKGIEYLIVILFLAAFVVFVRYLYVSRSTAPAAAPFPDRLTHFRVPDGLFFHQGHAWLRPETASVGTVGVDDFAQKLVGKVEAVELPPVGAKLEQGARAWSLVVGAEPIPMLSPATGEVIEVNRDVVRSPAILRDDPYGKGWLFKVRSPRIAAETHNLLAGKVARAWMEDALEKLHPVPHEVGPVMQDGGLVVDGIAQALGGENWRSIAREQLLSDEGAPSVK
jgi:glycine cleavage system H lipoate-binding protein